MTSHATTIRTTRLSADSSCALAAHDWVALPGGELDAIRPRALCPRCRLGGRRPLCLSCFKADRERERRLVAARDLHTASDAQFQCTLPFEPVNEGRLNHLRAERQAARLRERRGLGQFVDRRRRAQIDARHALERLAEGLKARGAGGRATRADLGAAVHALELQLPDSWMPFVAAADAHR